MQTVQPDMQISDKIFMLQMQIFRQGSILKGLKIFKIEKGCHHKNAEV